MPQHQPPAEVRLPVAALDLKRRADVIAGLNTDLAHLIDLALSARQARWNLRGAGFMALHKLFGAIARDTDRHADAVARRAVALGGVAQASLREAVTRSTLPPMAGGEREESFLLREIHRRLLAVAERLRESAARADDEAVTRALYLSVVESLESRAWMLESHLPG